MDEKGQGIQEFSAVKVLQQNYPFAIWYVSTQSAKNDKLNRHSASLLLLKELLNITLFLFVSTVFCLKSQNAENFSIKILELL